MVPINIKSGLNGVFNFSHFLLLTGNEVPRKEEISCQLRDIHHQSQVEVRNVISLAPAVQDMEGDLKHNLCFSFVHGETEVQSGETIHSGGYHIFLENMGCVRVSYVEQIIGKKDCLCFLFSFFSPLKLTKTMNITRSLPLELHFWSQPLSLPPHPLLMM